VRAADAEPWRGHSSLATAARITIERYFADPSRAGGGSARYCAKDGPTVSGRGARKGNTWWAAATRRSPDQSGCRVCLPQREVTGRKRFEINLAGEEHQRKAGLARNRFPASVSQWRMPLKAIIGYTGTLPMRLPRPLTEDHEKTAQNRSTQRGASAFADQRSSGCWRKSNPSSWR
jgi:hypothetical protein